MINSKIAHRFFIIAPVVATGVSSFLEVMCVRLWRTLFFFTHTCAMCVHSKKGVRHRTLSSLSDDQLRGTVDSGIISKLRKNDVRLLCCHRR